METTASNLNELTLEPVIDPQLVWNALRNIPDPEFGINLVDLGLIYDVECRARDVLVTMTLTTPTCPSGAWIQLGVEEAVQRIRGVVTSRVHVVFEPPWTVARLSDAARRQLSQTRD